MNIHFIGIGGFGMSGLAEYAKLNGHCVSGSDLVKTNITLRLESLGIKVFYNQSEDNIGGGIDLAVYSSAVKKDNPEYSKCVKENIKLLRRADYLGELVNEKFLIAVSGTHGKTSTTAMIAKVLLDNNIDPVVFVGGTVDFLSGGTAHAGKSNVAVVEADEYDRSFLTLKPDVIIITSLEQDHSDIYKDLDDLKNTFKEFINNKKPNGKIIAYGEENNIREICGDLNKSEIIFYGFNEKNSLRAVNIEYNSGSGEKAKFYFWTGHKTIGQCSLSVSGAHNVLNSLAAAMAAGFAGISMQEFSDSIKSFKGVGRRLELKYSGKYKVYDDYAHHPTEVKASLQALKNDTDKNVITIFQPHLFSRTKDFYKEFAENLSVSDYLILLEIYPARETPLEGVTSALISNELKNNYEYLNDNCNLVDVIKRIAKDGDTIVFMGAGDVTNLCTKFLNELK